MSIRTGANHLWIRHCRLAAVIGVVALAIALAPTGALAATNNIFTFAGTGTAGFSGDGGAATSAQINDPRGVAVASDGSVLIADRGNNRIRKISSGGTITTIAGTGIAGFSGDGGAATSAQVNLPTAVAIASDGSVLIADQGNQRVRKISSGGTITTIAGTGAAGFSGDGGAATGAQLSGPNGVAIASDGSVLISDGGNNRIRSVSSGGTITTFAGTGTAGFSGDGGAATSAQIYFPNGVAVASDGSVFIADHFNYRVRKVSSGGTISTIAGTGSAGFSGDGGAATNARLFGPVSPAVASDGSVVFVDQSNIRVRRISSGGTITSIAGTGGIGFSGDGGVATSAMMHISYGVAVALDGRVLISDGGNHRIRLVDAGLVANNGPIGPAGLTGPAGPAGLTGLAGPAGLAGPVGPGYVKLVMAAYRTTTRKPRVGRRLGFSYLLDEPAKVTLSLNVAKAAPTTLAVKSGKAGINRIAWNGKIAGRKLKPGAYVFRLVAQDADGERVEAKLKVRLRR